MAESYYDILGVSPNATEQEIRRAYRRMAKKFHPDINQSPGADSEFLRIKRAYDILINEGSRASFQQSYRNPMSSYEAYMAWKKRQQEKVEEEARLRYQEFLKSKERFRESPWYYPAFVLIYVAAGLCYLFSASVILLCAYVLHKTHIIVILLMLPFISGAVYFIKRTGTWFKEAKKFF